MFKTSWTTVILPPYSSSIILGYLIYRKTFTHSLMRSWTVLIKAPIIVISRKLNPYFPLPKLCFLKCKNISFPHPKTIHKITLFKYSTCPINNALFPLCYDVAKLNMAQDLSFFASHLSSQKVRPRGINYSLYILHYCFIISLQSSRKKLSDICLQQNSKLYRNPQALSQDNRFPRILLDISCILPFWVLLS